MAITLKRKHSLHSQITSALSTGKASDFAIHSHGHIFPVHKFVLRLRSEYFEKIFSNPRFTENDSNQLDLNDEGVDPRVLKALLQALYSDDYCLDAEKLKESSAAKEQKTTQDSDGEGAAVEDSQEQQGDEGSPDTDEVLNEEWPNHSILAFHVGVSVLADRFQIPGVDNLVASKVFAGLNDFNATWTTNENLTFGKQHEQLRTDAEFLSGLAILFTNGGRNDSKEAQQAIVDLLYDHMNDIKDEEGVEEFLYGTPGLAAALVKEQLHGPRRIKCATCGKIERISSATLGGEDIGGETGKAKKMDAFKDGHMKVCGRCGVRETMLLWIRAWDGTYAVRH